MGRVAWGFVGLGIVLRVLRLILNHPIWGDESYLVANLVTRDWLGLARPLDYAQVAPVLFLLIEKSILELLGTSAVAARLFPTACGIAALVVFRHLAGRLLTGPALPLAVAFLAVAFYPIRHGGEAKPYASDLLASVGLLTLAVEWLRRPNRSGWIWAIAAVTPLAILLSLPALFVAASVALTLVLKAGRRLSRPIAIALTVFVLTFALASVGVLCLIERTRPSPYIMAALTRDWLRAGAFPPSQPWDLILWLVRNHTSQMFAYPAGGARGASGLTTLCCIFGAGLFWRQRRRALLLLLVTPFLLSMAVAGFRAYPYGASARTMQFVAPAICLWAGQGLAWVIALDPRPLARVVSAWSCVVLMTGIGLFSLGYDAARPYKTVYERNARDFARWFWIDMGRDGELACLYTDFQLVFDEDHWQFQRTAAYLCYQVIYSERQRGRKPVNWDAISDQHPLRCVLFNEHPTEHPEFRRWLAEMTSRYNLRSIQVYPVNRGAIGRNWNYEDYYYVYEFVPATGRMLATHHDEQHQASSGPDPERLELLLSGPGSR